MSMSVHLCLKDISIRDKLSLLRFLHVNFHFQFSSCLCSLNSDLDIGFYEASCSVFETTSKYFPWFSENIVILCFGLHNYKSCYSFDGELNYIDESNSVHYLGGLAKYRNNLITVGHARSSADTELMRREKNGNFIWSIVDSNDLYRSFHIEEYSSVTHSLVNIPPSDINEEYVLHIGGFLLVGEKYARVIPITAVYKFNGTWSLFGKLNTPRTFHSSIYWNGAVYVIGGISDLLYTISHGYFSEDHPLQTKMEIWKIADSPDEFKTSENWPELDVWVYPHLFIVPDSFFPGN